MPRGGSGHFSEQNPRTKNVCGTCLQTHFCETRRKNPTANPVRKGARPSLPTPDHDKPSTKPTAGGKSCSMPYLDWAAIAKFMPPSVLYPWALSPALRALPPCQNLHLPAAFPPGSRCPLTCPSKTSPRPRRHEPQFPEPRLARAGLDYTHFDPHPGTRALPPARCIPGPLTSSWRGRVAGVHSPADKPRGWLAACQRQIPTLPEHRCSVTPQLLLASGPCSGSHSPGARAAHSPPHSLAKFPWYDPTSLNGHVVLSGQEKWRIGSEAQGRCRRSLSPGRGGWSLPRPRPQARASAPTAPRRWAEAAEGEPGGNGAAEDAWGTGRWGGWGCCAE